ncbi:MAG: hypothetical protein K1060chlam4_00717 [Candidatus Anoxychlamydiales bacterium]|nr:hypothetical protein [Candidatus Anoxychlamydiales bacterium]
MRAPSTLGSLPKTSSYESLPSEPKGYLSGSFKKYIVTALCIGGAIATREALGFEKTAIVVTAISTTFGFATLGFGSLIPHPNGYSKPNIELIQLTAQKNALIGGALGFAASLAILAAFESSFQMLKVMKGYID